MTNTHAQPLPIITTPPVSAALAGRSYGGVELVDYQLDAQRLGDRGVNVLSIAIDQLLNAAIDDAKHGHVLAAQLHTNAADRLVSTFGVQA